MIQLSSSLIVEMESILKIFIGLFSISMATGDVGNLFTSSGLGFFHFPQQKSSLYGSPTPTPTPTTEFFLPEVVDNRRRQKDHGQFIPLNSYLPPPPPAPSPTYLPPYRNSEQVIDGDVPFFKFRDAITNGGGGGYQYQKPIEAPIAAVTKTTTKKPKPIVILDPIISDRPIGGGYEYSVPPPPVHNSTPAPVASSLPFSTPAPVYLPAEKSSNYIRGESENSPSIRLHLHEMRCLHHPEGFFKAIFKLDTLLDRVPVVDSDSNDPRCAIRISASHLVVNIAEDGFHSCGVHKCATDLCLRLRFPMIHGMRSSSDSILTLHCEAQNKVAAKTHAIRTPITNDDQTRNAGIYAHGGSQNQFRTRIELLRKTTNGFTQHLQANDAVQLGEEMLLRAHVIAGDGWNYTKLTDVTLQWHSPYSGEMYNSANLIDSHGCLNPLMRSVCSQAPAFDPPLGHRLLFNAIMFQGMKSGDELVMSMRVTGCLEESDCQTSEQECGDTSVTKGRGKRQLPRRRRHDIGNSTQISEESTISFRVQMTQSRSNGDVNKANRLFVDRLPIIVVWGVLCFVLLLCALAIFAFLNLNKI